MTFLLVLQYVFEKWRSYAAAEGGGGEQPPSGVQVSEALSLVKQARSRASNYGLHFCSAKRPNARSFKSKFKRNPHRDIDNTAKSTEMWNIKFPAEWKLIILFYIP